MGVWLKKNFIEISQTTSKPGTILERYSYKDIDEEFIAVIVNDEKIKCVQIDKSRYEIKENEYNRK